MRDSPLLVWAQRAFDPTIRFAMKNVVIVLILAGGVLGGAIALMPRLGSEFLPALNEGALYVTVALPGNISLSDGRALTQSSRASCARHRKWLSVLTQLGRPEDGTDTKLPNNLELFVKLKPMAEWRHDKHTMSDLIEEMSFALQQIPGIDYNFSPAHRRPPSLPSRARARSI